MLAKSTVKTVLLVESEFLVRWRTSEHLREAGFRVIEATCAEDAIAVFSSSAQVNIVLADIDTPGDVNGHSLARWLGKYHPHVRMLMSSRDRQSTALVASGPTRDFIGKPYVYADLIASLQQMLARLPTETSNVIEFRSSASPAVPSDR